MLAVTGYRSRIVEELRTLLPPDEEVVRVDQQRFMPLLQPTVKMRALPPLGADLPICERYLLCAGLLHPTVLAEQTTHEITASLVVNLLWPLALCDEVLERNENARICVIGSESGFSWSHDDTYAAAKAGLHKYVETKKLTPHQQLICIAPSIIGDCAMTQRREDLQNLENRRENHPKKRFLRAVEVARLIHFMLYIDEGYLSGQVIRMNGGV